MVGKIHCRIPNGYASPPQSYEAIRTRVPNIDWLLPESRCCRNTFIETLFELGQQGDEAFSEMPHHPDLNAHMTLWATACRNLTGRSRGQQCSTSFPLALSSRFAPVSSCQKDQNSVFHFVRSQFAKGREKSVSGDGPEIRINLGSHNLTLLWYGNRLEWQT